MFSVFNKQVKININKGYLSLVGKAKDLRKIDEPSQVWISLIQHTGEPSHPIVNVGDKVAKGQKIAESDKFISSCIHSSISGQVKDITNIPHPKIRQTPGIIIANDNQDRLDEDMLRQEDDIENISRDEIIKRVKEAGIVGMGGGAFPSHVKLTIPDDKKLDTFILNGAECEPYLNADASLMIKRSESIILGMKLVMKAVGVTKAYIGIEDSNKGSIKSIKQALAKLKNSTLDLDIKIKVLPSTYPQGSEKQIIKTILSRQVPPSKLPYEVGVLVNNVATCFAIYEAVFFKKPLYERIVTVTGDIVSNPGSFIMPIGIRLSDIIDFCGVDKEDIGQIIFGGPMMGDAQCSLDTPIIKATSGLVIFSNRMIRTCDEVSCIKCGRCVNVCPMNLIPTRLGSLVKNERWGELDNFNIDDCLDCGSCSYICPSKVPLVHSIKLGKLKKDS